MPQNSDRTQNKYNVYETRPRKYHRGVELITDALFLRSVAVGGRERASRLREEQQPITTRCDHVYDIGGKAILDRPASSANAKNVCRLRIDLLDDNRPVAYFRWSK